MRVIVIGSGRVGASIARRSSERGDDVVVIDRDPDSIARLGQDFEGAFLVGTALDTALLERAGVRSAGAVVVATSDDNTNVVAAQIVRQRFSIDCVVVRVMDPRKAEWYGSRGLDIVSPTGWAISRMLDLTCEQPNDTRATGGPSNAIAGSSAARDKRSEQ